jgi:hypothetical protein
MGYVRSVALLADSSLKSPSGPAEVVNSLNPSLTAAEDSGIDKKYVRRKTCMQMMDEQFGAVIGAERIAIGLIIIIGGRRKLP